MTSAPPGACALEVAITARPNTSTGLTGTSRRAFLVGSFALGGAAALGACGSDGIRRAGTGVSPTSADGRGGLTVLIWPRAEHLSLIDAFTKATGTPVRVEIAGSDTAVHDRLVAADRSGRYDLVVTGGASFANLVEQKLIETIDHAAIPGYAGLSPSLFELPYDPGLVHSVPMIIGTTGIMWDRSALPGGAPDWGSFLTAAARPGVSGRVSAFDDGSSLEGIVVWADGTTLSSLDGAGITKAQDAVLERLAPHLRCLDNCPAQQLLDGKVVLAQIANGDARSVLLEQPDRFGWALGAPRTERWIDAWAMAKGTTHREEANALLDFVLQPANATTTTTELGFDTGVELSRNDVPALPLADMIRFTPEQVTTMEPDSSDDLDPQEARFIERVRQAIP